MSIGLNTYGESLKKAVPMNAGMQQLETALGKGSESTPAGQNHNNQPIQLDQLHHKVVMVKFSVKKRDMIPPALDRRMRQSEEAVDIRHGEKALEMGNVDLAQVGRERQGRVDTGFHAVDNLGPCHLAMLVRGLASNSYHLTDAFCYTKAKKYGCSPNVRSDYTYVITLIFTWGGDRTPLFTELEESLRSLGRMVWQYCHIWDNANTFSTVTVNLGGGPLRCINPKWAIVVRNRTLQAIPVEKPVEEKDE